MASSAAAGTINKGVWEPLSHIVYGYAIYPLSPAQIRDNLPPVLPRTGADASRYHEDERERAAHEIVALELGDEIYAFERYTPKASETRDVWYRGYVWCPARHESNATSDLLTAKTTTPDDTQVFIGIFPASHIHVRDFLADAEGRLAQVYSALTSGHDPYASIAAARGMETVKEEDDDDTASRKSVRTTTTRPPTQHSIKSPYSLAHLQHLRDSTPSAVSQPLKFLPPRPSLKSGDDTQSGAMQPIIDEISSALREWYNLMFLYLSRKEYALFHLVKEHIEALHLGRRQLLAQTLSVDETVNLRRDCVARLVTCNVVQGLDVIVRHPNWGGLVTVDVDGDIDPQSWVSAPRMYAMQAALAYMDVGDGGSGRPAAITSSLDLPHPMAPAVATSNSIFPDLTRRLNGSADETAQHVAPVKFYQVFLDMQAFVASPCLPGETAQLHFALYSKIEGKFISEDFCAILNHNGVLARDNELGGSGVGRVKTLFIDLSPHDVAGPIYLVCRIVRHGQMKLGRDEDRRRGSDAVRSRMDNPSHAVSGNSFNELDYPAAPGTPGPNGQSPSPIPLETPSSAHFRRPFGCAVLELTELATIVADGTASSALKEHTMPIFVHVQEDSFSTLHQDIIAGRMKEFEKSPRAEMVAVNVKAFHGDAKTIVRENPSLMQDAPVTQRLGFPDVVFPGDVRNELYVKLWNGEFFVKNRRSVAFTPTGPSNIEVTVEVRTSDGAVVEGAISQGSGEPPVSQFRSLVFYKTNTPSFGELIKVTLPVNLMPTCHLFFTFRQRSSQGRSPANLFGPEAMDRPFAFAYMSLFPERDAFMHDGSHTLVLYRITKPAPILIGEYWGAPQCLVPGQSLDALPIPANLARTLVPTRDKFTIRSQLCSTKFTQNPVVLGLMKWEGRDPATVLDILTRFPYVGELEIVKFLRDIFDALFAILTSTGNGAGAERDDLVFNCLVHVLGIVQDRRFSNFQPVLEVYIEKHFNSAGAYSHLLQSMNRLLANPTGQETAPRLRAAFRAWQYVFKFTVRSREFQRQKEEGMGSGTTAEHLEQLFKKEVIASLDEINKLMGLTQSSAIGTQTFAVQNFTSILPDLRKIFGPDEVVKIIKNFTGALAGAKGRMIIWKLVMFINVVKSYLFDLPYARAALVEDIVSWIMPYLGKFDEHLPHGSDDTENAKDAARIAWLESVRLSVSIIALILDKLQQNLVNPTILGDRKQLSREHDNVDYLLLLLPKLLDSYAEFQSAGTMRAFERNKSAATAMAAVPVVFPASHPFSLIAQYPSYMAATASYENTPFFNCGLGETAIVFLSLVLSSPRKSLVNLLDTRLEVEGKDNTATLLSQFFKVAVSIIENDAFPRTWLNANILAHRVLLKMMEPISVLLVQNYIPDQSMAHTFSSDLWKEAFYMLLSLLSSEQLVIEEHSPQKRRAVWRLAGDIRGDGATILLQLWEALGYSAPANPRYDTYQSALSPLIGQVVHLCLSHHEMLRVNAVQILYHMIVLHYNATGNFDEIEHEITNKLDSLFMNEAKGTDITRAFFISQLRQLFDSSAADDRLRERVTQFLNSVDTFLDLLLSLRTLPPGEEYHDDRVIATLRLLNFTRQLGKDDIYIKYVHQLVNMHLGSQNYVEAALSLKLHADLHDWDLNSFVEPLEDLGLPRQSRFHRKETLCLLILDYLGKGRAWETAIDICKELAFQHSEITFNYQRLSEVLHHQATLLEHIVHEPRYYADYFRVAFYGDFPDAIRDKEFIYRGFEWEKFGAFCERMLAKHPGAQLLKSGMEPSEELRQGSAQWIQCMAVTPEPDRTLPIFTQPDVPSAVRTYYEHCAINTFSISRPYNKTGAQPAQFQDVWTEKTYFLTEEAFPTVLRRSEVIDVRVAHVSPLEGAIQDLEGKTKELVSLSIRYASMYETGAVGVQTNHLAATLNNVVDAQAPNNIKTYREAFLNSDYITRNAQQLDLIQKLRDSIDEHITYINTCLGLHAKLCPPEMVPFHQTLERFFRRHFVDEISRLGLEEHTLPDVSSAQSSRNAHGPYSPSLYTDSEAHGFSTASGLQRSGSINVGRPSFSMPPSHLSIISNGTAWTGTTPGVSRATTMRRQNGQPPPQPSLLQRNLANLAKYGMNAVASGPGDEGRDAMSSNSLDGLPENQLESFVTVAGGGTSSIPPVPPLPPQLISPTSPTNGSFVNPFSAQPASPIGELPKSNGNGRLGSLSRFGSLSFGKRGR
ncbi:cytoplasmic protein [Exidia glandulosa HHB12029]|uniref:Cytoplasmic protein n=1 Tax=Exidia glandulosa HHB12029 TaxID=1314781 RepID=A0A165FB35_EXIGL|nr:cytoplasmic protein [Exidia glandulosa HHB12029]